MKNYGSKKYTNELIAARELFEVMEKYDGRFVRKMTDKVRAEIKEAYQTARSNGFQVRISDIQGYSKSRAPVINISGLMGHISRLAQLADADSKVVALPEVALYMRALDNLKDKWSDLKDAAAESGIDRAELRQCVPIPHFRLTPSGQHPLSREESKT